MDAKRIAEVLRKLDAQNFDPGDSFLASLVNNPSGMVSKWLPRQVSTAAGIPDQYDNPTPWLAPSVEDQIAAANNVAGIAQLGAFPMAPKSSGGTLGTFIGPKASTWDAYKAAAAAKMLDEGVDPAQVWQQHMIGRMPDGKLFSEIDDSAAKLIDKTHFENLAKLDPYNAFEAPIHDVFKHEQLYGNYPKEKNINFYFDPESTDYYGAMFTPKDNEIMLGAGLDSNQMKSAVIHELQHVIQDNEGWSRGGSIEQFLPEYKNAEGQYQVGLDYLNDLYDRNLNWRLGKPKGLDSIKTPDWWKSAIKDAEEAVAADKARIGDLEPNSRYRRLAGEAQARATQDRLNMNLDERRNSYPLAGGKLADIPLEQLIYRYDVGNRPALIEALRNGL